MTSSKRDSVSGFPSARSIEPMQSKNANNFEFLKRIKITLVFLSTNVAQHNSLITFTQSRAKFRISGFESIRRILCCLNWAIFSFFIQKLLYLATYAISAFLKIFFNKFSNLTVYHLGSRRFSSKKVLI
jgi:hypothetical protein